MCLLRRDFLLVAIGLVVPVKSEPVVNLDDQYDDAALGCPKCGELRYDYLSWIVGPGDAPDCPLHLKCCTCGTEYDSEDALKG